MLGTRSTTSGLYSLGVPLRTVYPEGVTLPQVFRQSGWRAESMGKVFHIGHGNTGDPDILEHPPYKGQGDRLRYTRKHGRTIDP